MATTDSQEFKLGEKIIYLNQMDIDIVSLALIHWKNYVKANGYVYVGDYKAASEALQEVIMVKRSSSDLYGKAIIDKDDKNYIILNGEVISLQEKLEHLGAIGLLRFLDENKEGTYTDQEINTRYIDCLRKNMIKGVIKKKPKTKIEDLNDDNEDLDF